MKKIAKVSFILLGLILSAIALYFVFDQVPFDDLATYLSTINFFWMVPAMLATIAALVFRALRWQVIIGSEHKVGFWGVFHPTAISFLLNYIFPYRAGEVAKLAILKKNENIPMPTGLATIATERLFDVLMLLAFFPIMCLFIQMDSEIDIAYGKYHLNYENLKMISGNILKLCVILIGGIILIGLSTTRKIINTIIAKIPAIFFFMNKSNRQKVSRRFCLPLIYINEKIASGLVLIKYPKKVGLCVIFSAIIWCLGALSYYSVSLGCPGIELSFMKCYAVMIIICIFITIPAAPGFWGVWEAGGVFALSLFGIAKRESIGYTLINHIMQMLPIMIVGLASMLLTGASIMKVFSQKNNDS